MVSNISYCSEFDVRRYKCDVWVIGNNKFRLKSYKYDEAIDLIGNGRYNVGLTAAASMALLSMCLDMFGFSVIVSGSACDFKLDSGQQSILLSMPFLGAMIMSYPWGYTSDTQGRRKSLLIAMWGSFAAATVGAFSPNWFLMAVLKLISSSFSSCAQSATYALVGESSPEQVRGFYMLVMTSMPAISLPVYMSLSYILIQYTDFSYDLVFIIFTPWRLLALVLALPLGVSAFLLHFFYESPKFLLNAGREGQALANLQKIWRVNRGDLKKYPVEQLVSEEESTTKHEDVSFLRLLWEQIAPLFRWPLLLRTLQLYYITGIIYSTINGLYIWFPFLSNAFFEGVSSLQDQSEGLCYMIASSYNASITDNNVPCESKTDIQVVWSSLVQGAAFVTINMLMSRIAHRRKTLLISILAVSCASSVGAAAIPHNLTSLILYIAIFLSVLASGFLFSYIVDLYPTSYCGMAACLAVMVARGSGLGGVTVIGTYIMSHCTTTFYVIGANVFSAIVVSFFLPADVIPKI